eukprot:1524797-Rhodomonas_salina.4
MEQGILALQENLLQEIELSAPLNLSGISRFCAALKQNRCAGRVGHTVQTARQSSKLIHDCVNLQESEAIKFTRMRCCNEIGASGLKALLTAVTSSKGQQPLEVGRGLQTLLLDNIDLDDNSASVLGMLGLASPLRRLSLRYLKRPWTMDAAALNLLLVPNLLSGGTAWETRQRACWPRVCRGTLT